MRARIDAGPYGVGLCLQIRAGQQRYFVPASQVVGKTLAIEGRVAARVIEQRTELPFLSFAQCLAG